MISYTPPFTPMFRFPIAELGITPPHVPRVLGCDRPITRPSKVHKSVLAPEYNLARLVANLSNPDPTWTVHTPPRGWVRVTVQEGSGEIHELRWNEMGLRGSLNFAFLPYTLRKVFLDKNHLTGQVTIGRVYENLHDLRVSYNRLDGPIAFEELPRGMVRFWGHNNAFSGGVDLSVLPPLIRILYLSENDFSGVVSFDSLPPAIEDLALDCNRFEGWLDFRTLPRCLTSLSLYNNSFTGRMDFSQVPPSMRQLALAQNKFEGDADISHLPNSVYFVSLFDNDVMVYIDDRCTPQELSKICVEAPPKKSVILNEIPARLAKWDTFSNVWYVYYGTVPQVFCGGSKKSILSARSESKPEWWKTLEENQWYVHEPTRH